MAFSKLRKARDTFQESFLRAWATILTLAPYKFSVFMRTISIAIGGSTPKKKLYDRVSKDAFERLELSAGKLARSVLRGLGAGNRVRLPYNKIASTLSIGIAPYMRLG